MQYVLTVEQSHRFSTSDPTLVAEVQASLAHCPALASCVYTADGELAWIDWPLSADAGWWERHQAQGVVYG